MRKKLKHSNIEFAMNELTRTCTAPIAFW